MLSISDSGALPFSTLWTHFANKKQKFGLRAQPALVVASAGG
jgi:hypothetical protein